MGMNKGKLKKIMLFFGNPRLILCFLLAWVITNGWSYIMLGLGTLLDVAWMVAVAGAYLAFLWLPISPEKIVTVAIAMALLRLLFPNDQKTLAVLRSFYDQIKAKKQKKSRKSKKTSAVSKQSDRA